MTKLLRLSPEIMMNVDHIHSIETAEKGGKWVVTVSITTGFVRWKFDSRAQAETWVNDVAKRAEQVEK